MSAPLLRRRFASARLVEALSDTPVVLIHGPRQCGKTTLARTVGEVRGYAYHNLDDFVVLASAMADPAGFVANLPERVILDQVQRAPGLFTALKSEVNRRRTPGRFLLTGSANVLLRPTLADSLAGRMGILRLHPLAQCELAGRAPSFLAALFAGRFKTRAYVRLGARLVERVVAGGYPAALVRAAPRRRASWYRDYVEALVQRDVRDLARISSLDVLPRLLAFAAAQTARLMNVSDLAGPFHLSRPTIRDYLTLLERVFLLDVLPPWHSNRLSRLVKAPKVHVGDSGVACALLGLDAEALRQDRSTFGFLLETFVFQERRRQASWHEKEIRFHHFRDRDDAEVDILLERGANEVAGVEVKAGSTITLADFRGLRKLRDAAGERFSAGVVLGSAASIALVVVLARWARNRGSRWFSEPLQTGVVVCTIGQCIVVPDLILGDFCTVVVASWLPEDVGFGRFLLTTLAYGAMRIVVAFVTGFVLREFFWPKGTEGPAPERSE
ncbi:MAG: ATP-binding protein [Planctomycetes bacterium]|nr:ATP-binding protein [Planctomycetota bacterium]